MRTDSPSDPAPLPSVLGDFVLGWGRQTHAWLSGLPGFETVSTPDDEAQVAVRGAVQRGEAPGGARWLALADLVAGDVALGARALGGGQPPQHAWRGRFAQVAWHPAERQLCAVTDHFSSLSLYVLVRGDVVLVGNDLRVLASSPWCSRTVDLVSVYHYLNFAQIPAPGTIFDDIRRLEPATRWRWRAGTAPVLDRYYVPEYPEDQHDAEDALAGALRERMVATVGDYRPRAGGPGATALDEGWGCFLSGGTDSSSIVSILSRQALGPVQSFTIGFAEERYDEERFARTAAAACGASANFERVSDERAQSLVTRVVAAYDQPFGNASAIPTLACVDLARARGARVMLAGDGGDEIFGGNERYAKDQVMESWYGLPEPVKAVGRAVGGLLGKVGHHFLNRVENFFERSSLPNPDRFYTDDSFASDHYHEMLTPEFRRAVDRDASLGFMRAVYGLGSSGGPLHRIMRLDLMMAIAQNDLRKVHGAAQSAGVSVRFPYLDPLLVAHVSRLPERWIVRGVTKRYLFKRAMRGILPEEILRKRKQGFGLPVAVWLRTDGPFKAMVRETLFDARARARGWWRPEFVENLLAQHERGAWDYADCLYRLFVLELWLRRYVDGA
ncbi:MAG TPA: asparagine synthase C-terminal domain-containing protein [Polyangia bacterium]|nr:asparagine synthase C-terminal domain-containing protein [Polyangia bacterium]